MAVDEDLTNQKISCSYKQQTWLLR